MELPKIIYLKDKLIASWAINDGREYIIQMEFENADDGGKTPKGQGFFYCTDHSIDHPNDHSLSAMGWLSADIQTIKTTMNGFQLSAFLLLPLVDDPSNGILQIGPNLGQKQGPGNSFPDAAELSYSFQNQNGKQMPQDNNNNSGQVNTYFVKDAMQNNSNVLYHKFTKQDGKGVLLTPKNLNPKFEKSVNILLIDDAGDIKGVLDKTAAGDSFWCPIDSNNLYLVAALERTVNGEQQSFTVGDPRTNGTISVDEVPEDFLSSFFSQLWLKLKKIFR